MTNLAKIKHLYLWKPSICKRFEQPSLLYIADKRLLKGYTRYPYEKVT